MSRSEEVIADYKKRKLASSALRRIHELILGFEEERAADLRFARIGMMILLVLLGVAVYYWLSADQLTLF